MYLKVYQEPPLADAYVKEGTNLIMGSIAIKFLRIFSESFFSLSALEAKLVSYISDPEAPAQPFDVTSIPKISRAQAAKEVARAYILCYSQHLSDIAVMSRAKHAGDTRRPEYLEGSHAAATNCCRDTVRLRAAARGSARVRYLWPRSQQQHEAGPTYRERDRVPSFGRQAYLQGTRRLPGTHGRVGVHL